MKHQAEIGIDSVNDGELSKITFQHYCFERITGFEDVDWKPGLPVPLSIAMRDAKKFGDYFAEGHGGFASAGPPKTVSLCTGPLTYVGHEALKRDIDNFKAALKGVTVEDAFLPANTPGTLEHALRNVYYKTDADYLEAAANVLRVEYKAITDAGLTLQLDDPDLPDGWLIYPEMSVADYRKYAGLRIDALKHALAGIPREQVRLHVCWGSFHGPHQADIPLKEIADLIFSVPAQSYSIEASNPAHEHEWQVFERIKPPEGHGADPRRHRPRHRFHRASRTGGAAPGALRQAGRARERRRRQRLRHRHARQARVHRLGEARSAGRGRADRQRNNCGELPLPLEGEGFYLYRRRDTAIFAAMTMCSVTVSRFWYRWFSPAA